MRVSFFTENITSRGMRSLNVAVLPTTNRKVTIVHLYLLLLQEGCVLEDQNLSFP